jgi:hypothetical protein
MCILDPGPSDPTTTKKEGGKIVFCSHKFHKNEKKNFDQKSKEKIESLDKKISIFNPKNCYKALRSSIVYCLDQGSRTPKYGKTYPGFTTLL